MGEAEARPDGPHCVPRLDPQSDQGSLQPPLASTCHPQQQGRKPSGAHGPLEMHARQECSRVSQATMEESPIGSEPKMARKRYSLNSVPMS